MNKNIILKTLLTVMVMFSIQSCGSSNTGGTVYFNTVNVTASVDLAKNPLLADLAKWTGTPCDTAATMSIENDVVNFNVNSTVNISNGTSSPVILRGAIITFTPADTISPALPALYSPTQLAHNYRVLPGATLSVPIEVANHAIKEYIGSALVCTNNRDVYTYHTKVDFDAVEVNTGKTAVITSVMTVRFADFAD